jgi:hypothetical protein
MPHTSGPVAISLDSNAFRLSMEEAAELQANRTHSPTTRTIQRNRASAQLDDRRGVNATRRARQAFDFSISASPLL